MNETTAQEIAQRYFWSGWFTGQSFRLLSVLFIVFSLYDLLASSITMMGSNSPENRMMNADYGVSEGNGLANFIYSHYGIYGVVTFKVFTIFIVLLTTRIISKTNQRLGHGVLWGGILVMALLSLRHLLIMLSLMFIQHF